MNKARLLCSTLVALVAVIIFTSGRSPAGPVLPVPPPAAATTVPANVAIASRFALQAHHVLQVQEILPPHWKMAAALLDAAAKLDPSEPRYRRLLIDALMENRAEPGALDAAVAAANAYRQLRPDDRFIQMVVINLYLNNIQGGLDKKLTYLKELLGKQEIDAEVRSYIAVRCATLSHERSAAADEAAFIDQALRLNPINLEALQRQFDAVLRNPTALPIDRVRLSLAMLKSNPVQFNPMVNLAVEMGELGLCNESLNWFQQARELAEKAEAALPREFIVRYALEAFIADQNQLAQLLADMILRVDPEDYPSMLIRLMQERRRKSDGDFTKYRDLGHNILVNHLNLVRASMRVPGATTRRADQPRFEIPDLSNDNDFLAKTGKELQGAYLQAIAELAWFQLYYDSRPADARRLTRSLAALVQPGDPAVDRLDGWCALMESKMEEAGAKLSAAANKGDVIARMGIIRLAGAKPEAEQQAFAEGEATKLLTANPSGGLGALLFDEFYSKKIRVVPKPEAEPVKKELAAFPAQLLKIITAPQTFYTLKATPVKIPHAFGEPMMVRVVIQNVSNFDLTIGIDGVIRPELWFDATSPQLKGIVNLPMIHVAVDRINQQGILRPGQSITQLCRVDDGDLSTILVNFPQPLLSITMLIRTNPLLLPTVYKSLPGGFSTQFEHEIQRQGFDGTEDSFRLVKAAIQNGAPSEKIRNIDLLSSCAIIRRRVVADGNATPQDKDLLRGFIETLRLAAEDPDAAVHSWARHHLALLNTGDERLQIIKQMVGDRDPVGRMLGLASLYGMPPADVKAICAPIAAKDPEGSVAKFAAGLIDMASIPVAAQPADPNARPAANIFEPPTTLPVIPLPTPASQPTTAPIFPTPLAPTDLSPSPSTAPSP